MTIFETVTDANL